jgi:hypothetical protein
MSPIQATELDLVRTADHPPRASRQPQEKWPGRGREDRLLGALHAALNELGFDGTDAATRDLCDDLDNVAEDLANLAAAARRRHGWEKPSGRRAAMPTP